MHYLATGAVYSSIIRFNYCDSANKLQLSIITLFLLQFLRFQGSDKLKAKLGLSVTGTFLLHYLFPAFISSRHAKNFPQTCAVIFTPAEASFIKLEDTKCCVTSLSKIFWIPAEPSDLKHSLSSFENDILNLMT